MNARRHRRISTFGSEITKWRDEQHLLKIDHQGKYKLSVNNRGGEAVGRRLPNKYRKMARNRRLG